MLLFRSSAILICLSLIACGDSSSPANTSTSTPSSAQSNTPSSSATNSSLSTDHSSSALPISSSITSSSAPASSLSAMSSSAFNSSSSTASSSSVAPTMVDDSYCGELIVAHHTIKGNRYMFDAPAGECFGIIDDAAQKKTVPLTVSAIEADLIGVTLDTEIKLYNSIVPINGVNIGEFNFTVNLTNSSDTIYCSVRLQDDLHLYDADGNELIVVHSGGQINADLYSTGNDYRDGCISPGETYTYTETTQTISPGIFEQVASASADILEGRRGESGFANTPYVKLPNLSPGMLSVELSRYPDLKLTVINTLDYAIELQDDAHRVEYFDDDGYFVASAYMYLHEGLGVDRTDLTDSDYLIEASGGTFTLRDEISDVAAVGPSTATKAIVYLRWLPAN